MIGIYLITNQVNGKKYVGQSQNIEQRWRAHRSRPFNPNSTDYEKPLYRAIRKYGLANFSFEVIEECAIEDLNDREIDWIDKYDTTNPENGYNLSKGGETGVPQKLTVEDCDKIIELLANSDISQEDIAKKFNVSQRLISGINLGQCWIKQGLSYPIRKRQAKKCYCQSCGKEISIGSTFCIDCNGHLRRKVERPNREELKALIRTIPFTKIGESYGVSDNAVRKWCKTEGLPSKSSVIKSLSDEDWALI